MLGKSLARARKHHAANQRLQQQHEVLGNGERQFISANVNSILCCFFTG
jgi:hypothetical protein